MAFPKYEIIGVDTKSNLQYSIEYVLGKFALTHRLEYWKSSLPEANFFYKQINLFPHEENTNERSYKK